MAEEALAALRRARSGGGDTDAAFRELDAAFRLRLLRYFRSSSFSREDSEDLVQKTLLRVFQGIGGVREEARLLPWLFTVARNVKNTAFERRPPPALPLDAVAEPADTRDMENPERRVEALWKAIESLPPRQRQCLPLQVRDGMSYEEIAATLRLSVNTVRNHLAAARENLRRFLEGNPS